MIEFRVTFVRYNDEGMEERGSLIEAADLDEAASKALEFCKRNRCHLKRVEWYDEEEERWINSDVQYA